MFKVEVPFMFRVNDKMIKKTSIENVRVLLLSTLIIFTTIIWGFYCRTSTQLLLKRLQVFLNNFRKVFE